MREVQLTYKQGEVAPATTSDLVVMNHGKTLKEELSSSHLDQFSREIAVAKSMNKIVDGACDGAYDNCILKGRSLVNLATEKKVASDHSVHFSGRRITGKVIILNAYKNNTCYFNLWSIDEEKYIKYVNIRSNAFIYEVPSGQCIYNIYDTAVTNNTDNLALFANVMILEYQEGMENWDIPYFEGLCDVKTPVLRNIGKNLYKDEGGKTNFTIDGFTGVESTGGTRFVPNFYTPVKSNMTYTLYRKTARLNCGIRYYDKNKKYIPQSLVPPYNAFNSLTFTTPSNCHYVRFIDETNIIDNKYMIYLGEEDKSIEYEPYKSNTLSTPKEIILHSLPNGVQDTYNPLTGEYVKRVGEIVLDGNEGRWDLAQDRVNTMRFNCFSLDVPLGINTGLLQTNKLPYQSPTTHDQEGAAMLGGVNAKVVGFSILKTKLATPNVEGLKQYLQTNPITVQYELATPIIKKVDPKGHPFAYENGHVILESGYQGQSLLPELVYSVPASKSGVLSTTSKTILSHEQHLHKLENLLLRESVLMDYRFTLSLLDEM